jgi:sensor histidine kinase YesM
MIEVINTGRKLTPEDLARISRLLGEEESAKGHVGIRNVNQRLHLIFGETAGLRFTVNARGETVATVCQPLQRAPEGPEGGREQ